MARQLQQSKMLSVAAVSDGPNVHNEFFHFHIPPCDCWGPT